MTYNLSTDLRRAVRALLLTPSFTAIATLTLAIGIGATTAVFSVVYGVLLKPLPFPDPEQLVGLYHRAPGVNLPVVNQGAVTYFTYLDNQRVFAEIAAWDTSTVSLTGQGDPERAPALSVTDGLFPMLRVPPFMGRLFNKEDDTPKGPTRVVLTHGYWRRKFGGASNVIGQSLQIDGRSYEIIGVLPETFRFLDLDPAVVLPMQLDRADAVRISFGFQAVARLKPGVSLEAASAEIGRIIPLIVEKRPRLAAARLEPNLQPFAKDMIGDVDRTLWILLGTVFIVLLIACANVANLFLVRAEGRQQAFAVQAALGASRWHTLSALLAESVVLALAGGILGTLLARGGLALLVRLAPAGLPRLRDIGIDPMVLLFTLATSFATALLFGVIPMVRFAKPNLRALREGGRGGSDSPGRHRARNVLAVAELALALVLLVVAGLMVRTIVAVGQIHPGFVRPAEVQTFRLAVPVGLASEPTQVARIYQDIVERMKAIPGVTSVGLSSSITLDGENNANGLIVEGVSVPEGQLPPLRRFKFIGPGYFETMGNPLVAGRDVTWTEIQDARPVVVISENLAREYWRTPAEALGKRVKGRARDQWFEVIGVVGNERDDGLNKTETKIVYFPLLTAPPPNEPVSAVRNMAFAARSTRVGFSGFLRELQQAVWAVNPTLPLAGIQTLTQIQTRSMARLWFAMVMLTIVATMAVVLGIVGIYGVIAYIATQRTREIGIRMALGAQRSDVRSLFLSYGLKLTITGIALGLAIAFAVTRFMSTLLSEVSPVDPLTYGAVSIVLGAVALLASYLPAGRASRLDPIIALRFDR